MQDVVEDSEEEIFEDASGEFSAEVGGQQDNGSVTEPVWQAAFKKAIAVEVELPEKWKQIRNRIVEVSVSNYTGEVIDVIYGDIVKLLLEDSGQEGGGGRVEVRRRGDRNRPANDRARHKKRNNRPPNRNERRRYFYARCQDPFNKNPRKLAELVVVNDFSVLQKSAAPAKRDVKDLYG